jgi:hypothetical protein
MTKVCIAFLSLVLLGATAQQAVKLPGAAVLDTHPALRTSMIALTRYPIPSAALRFPASIVTQARVSAIPVLLPRVLPKSAPAFTRIAASPGIYRLELTFTPNCNANAHVCHYATLLSQTVITPPADAQQIVYKGVTMYYHAPVCFSYCTDGGLYFMQAGVWHSIEARGQLPTLESIYDSEVQVK